MTGSQSWRTVPLPRNWKRIRRRILRRDKRCRLGYDGCTVDSTEVDHIGDPADHSPANLRGVCHTCHLQRSLLQARAGRRSRVRPPEKHPGAL